MLINPLSDLILKKMWNRIHWPSSVSSALPSNLPQGKCDTDSTEMQKWLSHCMWKTEIWRENKFHLYRHCNFLQPLVFQMFPWHSITSNWEIMSWWPAAEEQACETRLLSLQGQSSWAHRSILFSHKVV